MDVCVNDDRMLILFSFSPLPLIETEDVFDEEDGLI